MKDGYRVEYGAAIDSCGEGAPWARLRENSKKIGLLRIDD
jgi:hypothetical protein